jgi:hypothetical protein
MARLTVMLCVLCLLGFAGITGARAAECINQGTGCTVNGAPPSGDPMPLNAGDRVTGPCSVKTASNELLLLGSETTLVVEPAQGGVETFTVASGWVQGELGDKTVLNLSIGKLFVAEGGKAEFYAENLGSGRSLFRIAKGAGVVVFGQFRASLSGGNAMELSGSQAVKDVLEFNTLPGNREDLLITANVSDTLAVDLKIPRASMGRVEPWKNKTQTKISSDPGSWQAGQIQIQTRLGDVAESGKTGVLGPGTFAIVDNITGEFVEFGFKEIAPAVIERAISLTSEFALLAVSNFFGLDTD